MTSQKKALVLFYSRNGGTERMANIIADAIKGKSIDVKIEKVDAIDLSLLPTYDAIVLGSPTYFSNVAWPVKKLIDESIVFYRSNQLSGKVAGIFTSSGTEKDARDCLKMLQIALGVHHGMRVVEGIVRTASEPDEETGARCREYGGRLAEAMLKDQG
jgi:NAD(P)H dehydrogenase (quinone)